MLILVFGDGRMVAWSFKDEEYCKITFMDRKKAEKGAGRADE